MYIWIKNKAMPAIQYFHVDAFTSSPFGGNPAAVCLLESPLPDEVLQQIAAELFLPETAFLLNDKEQDQYRLRWFTPEQEMDLCGHATLATAHVMFNERSLGRKKIRFNTMSGVLEVEEKEGTLWLSMPSRP